jgi:nitrile hydratase
MRRTIESFSPETYEKLSYYERWITAIEALMIEKGILTREEIDRKVQEMENDGEI